MKITPKLKAWLQENCALAAEATDEDARKSASTALVEGKLSVEAYKDLSADEDEQEANEFVKRFDSLADSIEQLMASLTPKAEDKTDAKTVEPEQKQAETPKEKAMDIGRQVAKMGGTPDEPDRRSNPTVKRAADQYATGRKALHFPLVTKEGLPHPRAGRPVEDGGRGLDEPSQQDKACAGVWAKFQLKSLENGNRPQLGFLALNDHDRDVLAWMCEKSEWDDVTMDGMHATIRRGFPGGLKALIDDAASGGLEAAPIVFDDMVIEVPLLYGELFPQVNTIPIPRGRRVEGVSTSRVTMSWGGVDDTAISLFNTASYVSAFDTTIFRVEGSIRVGLDFLSDTPINFGEQITRQYGEALQQQLDNVIAVGNGTTQPEGCMNKAGATSVNFGGTTSIGNYESLMTGVHKRELQGPQRSTAVFCGTDTSYRRAKAIPVGAADSRRLFGDGAFGTQGYLNYTLAGFPYKINESLSNSQIFFAVLGRYRMYRRRGLTVRTSQEGDTLIRNNEFLYCVTARFGGQAERGATIARTTTAPA